MVLLKIQKRTACHFLSRPHIYSWPIFNSTNICPLGNQNVCGLKTLQASIPALQLRTHENHEGTFVSKHSPRRAGAAQDWHWRSGAFMVTSYLLNFLGSIEKYLMQPLVTCCDENPALCMFQQMSSLLLVFGFNNENARFHVIRWVCFKYTEGALYGAKSSVFIS